MVSRTDSCTTLAMQPGRRHVRAVYVPAEDAPRRLSAAYRVLWVAGSTTDRPESGGHETQRSSEHGLPLLRQEESNHDERTTVR